MIDLKNLNIILTGATGVIGNSILDKLALAGSNILATGTNEEKLKKIQDKNKNINILKFDISNHEKIDDFVEECNKILSNKIDVLINNAGITLDNLSIRMKQEEWKNVIDLNLSSTFLITKNVIKNKADEIIHGCVKNIKPIDDQIDQSIKNWRFDRINSVDLNILRIAVFEILFSKGIPVPVSIKEAIVLALKYSSDESCSFINGILDTISKRALQ